MEWHGMTLADQGEAQGFARHDRRWRERVCPAGEVGLGRAPIAPCCTAHCSPAATAWLLAGRGPARPPAPYVCMLQCWLPRVPPLEPTRCSAPTHLNRHPLAAAHPVRVHP